VNSSGTGYLLVNRHGFITLKTAVFIEYGSRVRDVKERLRCWQETRESGRRDKGLK
jgi:hypothetical protein